MRDAVRATLAVVLVLVAAACSPPPAPASVRLTPSAESAMEAATPLVEDAQREFEAGRWDASIALYEEALAAYGTGDDAALGGWRDQALYNTACAHARAGRMQAAAETFARSVAFGLRTIVARGPSGEWMEQRGLTLEHLLADADLDTIRETPAYLSAVRPYLAAGDVTVEFTRPETSSLVPAVVVLAPGDEDLERTRAAWRAAAQRPTALVVLEPPVRPSAKDRVWILGDGDERWAVAKVREALDVLLADVRIDHARVYLAGVGGQPGEAAWAAALAAPVRVAGFAAPGARFHAAWHADAIADAPTAWRVVLGRDDAAPAKMLKDRGIEAVRIEPAAELPTTAAAVLEAMLRTK
jgi:hypothetical protein